MSLDKEIGGIGNAEYFHYINKKAEPTKDYEEVLQVKDVRESLKKVVDKINSWRNTGITDGRLSAMITNGGYIEKFEIIKILKEEMGDLIR